jgi:hypothetical protein
MADLPELVSFLLMNSMKLPAAGCQYKKKVTARSPALRPLQKAPFCPISASGSNFNPRNIQYIPAVKIIAFLDLDQNWKFFKGLALSGTTWQSQRKPALAQYSWNTVG